MNEVWTLRRSTADGKLAGVCAAVASRFGVDPLLVRIVCVLLALSAGIGLALYAAAWLLLPTDRDPVPVLHRVFPASRNISRSTLNVLVVVWTLLVATVTGQVLTIGLGPVLVVAVLWWFGVIKPRGAAGHRNLPELPVVADSERDFVQEAWAWRSRVESQVRNVDWLLPVAESGRPAGPAGPVPVAAPAATYDWQPAPWTATQPAPPYPPPSVAVRTAPSATLAAHSRRGKAVGLVTAAAVLGSWLVLGALGVAAVVPYAAAALLAVGIGLIVSAWLGRPRGLLPGAVVLLLVALVSLAPAQPLDDLHYRPTDAASLPDTISSPVGDVVVDLSDLTVPAGRTVAITAAVGDVRIVCPENVNVVVESRLGPGTYTAFGVRQDGPGHFGFSQQPDPSRPTLTLQVDLGVGELEVKRP